MKRFISTFFLCILSSASLAAESTYYLMPTSANTALWRAMTINDVYFGNDIFESFISRTDYYVIKNKVLDFDHDQDGWAKAWVFDSNGQPANIEGYEGGVRSGFDCDDNNPNITPLNAANKVVFSKLCNGTETYTYPSQTFKAGDYVLPTPDLKQSQTIKINTEEDRLDYAKQMHLFVTYYNADQDKDGYGPVSMGGSDCDDQDANKNPEMGNCPKCNLATAATFYADKDNDGFGDPWMKIQLCNKPEGYVADNTDCDDSNGAINPAAGCNTCDPSELVTYYADQDGDGFGDAKNSVQACEKPKGHVADNQDCDDTNKATHPGQIQALIGFDSNCDGSMEIDLIKDVFIIRGAEPGMEVGSVPPAIGDVNGDGLDDVVIDYKEGILCGIINKPNKFKPGYLLTIPIDCDFTITAEPGISVGGPITITKLDSNDHKADIVFGLYGYNGKTALEVYGKGDGTGGGAFMILYGRDTFEKEYFITYDMIATGQSANLKAQKIGVIKATADKPLLTMPRLIGDIDGKSYDDGKGGMITPVGEFIFGSGAYCEMIPALPYTGIWKKSSIESSFGKYEVHAENIVQGPCDQIASGDIDGNGLHEIIFGDAGNFPLSNGKGWLVYGSSQLPSVIDFGDPSIFQTTKTITFSGDHLGAGAGSSVSIQDLDEDGLVDLCIAAGGDSTAYENAGATYCIPAKKLKEAWNGDNPLIKLNSGLDIVLDGDIFDLGGMAIYGDMPEATLPATGLVGRTCPNHTALLLGSGLYGDTGKGRLFYLSKEQFLNNLGKGIMANQAKQIIENNPSFGGQITATGDLDGDGIPDLTTSDGGPSFGGEFKGYIYFFLSQQK